MHMVTEDIEMLLTKGYLVQDPDGTIHSRGATADEFTPAQW